MSKTTIILGDQCSGKSTIARQMSKGRKTFWLWNCRGPFAFSSIPEDTELIIIDEHISGEVFDLIKTKRLVIHRQCKPSIEIPRPDVIIISNNLKESDFCRIRDIEFIHVEKVN